MISLITCNYKSGEQLTGNTVVRLKNNTFVNNLYEGNLINVACEFKSCSQNYTSTNTSQVTSQIRISKCYFKSNKFTHVIRLVSLKTVKVFVEISGTIFEELSEKKNDLVTGLPAIFVKNVTLSLEGPVTFHKVHITKSLIQTLISSSVVAFHILI